VTTGTTSAPVSGRDTLPATSVREAAPVLDIDPRSVADLALFAPIAVGANLVTLDPGPEVAWLVVKRASATLATFALAPEVGTAAAARLAHIADIDPASLVSDHPQGSLARRVKVRGGDDAGELLVTVAAAPEGLRVEVRPLDVNGRVHRTSLLRCTACGALQTSRHFGDDGAAVCEFDGKELAEAIDKPEPGGFMGAYRLGEILGEGGMGRVIAGEHAFLGRPVAIKLLHRTIAEDPLAGRRFLAEARAASRLRHSSIVEILDYGVLDDGRPYMVMERLDGESLDAKLSRETAFEPEIALLLAREIAVALGAAHAGGVIHLDLKPANVILVDPFSPEAPKVKLIDFGAAVRTGSPTEEGTPAYMSPEHACGEPADPRSDLYALGVVLFEMLTGHVPFDQPNALQVLRAHLNDVPPTVSSPKRPLPLAVTRLVDRALKKKADERQQTAPDFVAGVDAALAALRRKEWLRWLP
jgi:hypothetical protein